MYMLDTNICIFAINHRSARVIEHITEHPFGDICISAITYAELRTGAEKSMAKERSMQALMMFLSAIKIVPFDASASEEYGRIRAQLERQGTPIGPLDTLIASQAKSMHAVIVTNNVREFERVAGLEWEDWTK